MKKVLFTLIAVISVAISANAADNRLTRNLPNSTEEVVVSDVKMNLVFRTTQNLCHGKDQLILYRSGSFELYQNSVEVYSGTYTIDTDNSVVVLFVGDSKLRCKFQYKSDGQNIASLTFQNETYWPCNR
ncbi:MAG: hypothetical protein MJZ94_07365 [Bacteroidales bacterium]|nr:hypothetical protein [Bacteroidales bacterium]